MRIKIVYPLLATFLAGSHPTPGTASASSQKPVTTYTVDYVKPPGTLTDLIAAADAVVRGTIRRSEVKMTSPSGSGRVVTAHEVLVNEVFKTDGRVGAVGGTITVIQSAGSLELPDKTIRVNGGYAPFTTGGEYILCLEWNDRLAAFDVMYGPAATFAIVQGVIDTPATRGPAVQAKGLPAQIFIGQIRAIVR